MVGWGVKMKYNELSGGSKIAITHVVPVKFVDFPNDAKRRFLLRSRRFILVLTRNNLPATENVLSFSGQLALLYPCGISIALLGRR